MTAVYTEGAANGWQLNLRTKLIKSKFQTFYWNQCLLTFKFYLNPSKSSTESFSCVSNICMSFSGISLSWDNSSPVDA